MTAQDVAFAVLCGAVLTGAAAACYLGVLLYRSLRDALLPEDSVN